MNEPDVLSVAIRPMIRADVDAFAAWGTHADLLFAPYNVPALDRTRADDLWRHLVGRPRERRPFAGLVAGRFAAQLLVRTGAQRGIGDIGISLDPALIGRGLGTRILRAFAGHLHATERFTRLTLDVAAYNERAIRAYRAAGFVTTGERWGPAEPGLDLGALRERLGANVRHDGADWTVRILYMEMPLDAEA